MDPDWPRNPPSSIICVLCKSVMPFSDGNPERFFRHLIADHYTYFNLNLLLEISILQPRLEDSRNVKELSTKDIDDDEYVSKKFIKKELKTIPDPKEDLYEDDERDNNCVDYEDSDSSDSRDVVRNIISPLVNSIVSPNSDPIFEDETSSATKIIGNTNNSEQEFDMSFFFSNLPTAEPLESINNESRIDKEEMTLNKSANRLNESEKKRYPSAPSLFIPTVPSIQTDVSALDPISIVKKEPRVSKTSQQIKVPLVDEEAETFPTNPNRHLVPEDLQRLIIQGNKGRSVKFTLSQRQNTQMVVDDYVLKKKKGPYSTRGRRVINWKCVNDVCPYTCVTCESQILEKSNYHNHPPQPELYVKKQARVKIRESIHNEIDSKYYTDRAVSTHVYDVVNDTEDHDREKIGSIDALKQAARRFNRKLLNKESKGLKSSPLKPLSNPNTIINVDEYSIVTQASDNIEFEKNEWEKNRMNIYIENTNDVSDAPVIKMKTNNLDSNVDSVLNEPPEDNIEELLKASPNKMEFVSDELINEC